VNGSIKSDVSAVTGSLNDMMKVLDGRQKDILRYGAAVMKQETARAFAAGADPATGRPWQSRSVGRPWAMLQHTGTLRGALEFGYGVTKKDNKQKLFGKIKDGRRRDGALHVVVAGAAQFGRTKRRTDRGTKLRGQAPRTGATPPRPFFGFGSSARRRIKDYAEKRLVRAFN
jgi:phage gpG-like protein